jgi:hypothetical protein
MRGEEEQKPGPCMCVASSGTGAVLMLGCVPKCAQVLAPCRRPSCLGPWHTHVFAIRDDLVFKYILFFLDELFSLIYPLHFKRTQRNVNLPHKCG